MSHSQREFCKSPCNETVFFMVDHIQQKYMQQNISMQGNVQGKYCHATKITIIM